MTAARLEEVAPVASAHGATDQANVASTSIKDRVEGALAMLFGLIFLVLSAIVSIETISRKLFNFSLQGADELGGYARGRLDDRLQPGADGPHSYSRRRLP